MFQIFKKNKRKMFLKSYLYRYLDDPINIVFVDSLYDLLFDFLRRNDVRMLVRHLDEETFLALWSCLIDLKNRCPSMFVDYEKI